jgi:hypothetical protein
MMAAIVALMTGSNWPRDSSEGVAMAYTVAITLLFSYLQFFVRYLEDPFQYPEGYQMKCYQLASAITNLLFAMSTTS